MTDYAIRRMNETDLEDIAEKAKVDFGGGLAGLFSQKALEVAFETDPVEHLVLEADERELAGFAFCGVKHEKDGGHPVTVGYMGYLSAPTVFGKHASKKNRKALWRAVISSLEKREVDIVRWLVYGDPSPDISAREDVELAEEYGFVKKDIPKNERIIDEKHRNGFYTILKLSLSDYKRQVSDKKYNIRRMREQDVDEVSEIFEVSFDPLETRAPSEIRVKMGNGGWVCEYENRVVGCAFSPVYENKDLVELQGQAVHPDYRERGIATEMTKTILNYLKREGVKTVVAGVRNDNLAEYNVLSRLGFEIAAGETWMFCKELKKNG